MMNSRLIHIALIAFTSLLYSCAGESKDANMMASPTESAKATNDIPQEFFTELEDTSKKLTQEQLEAFELRAIQKFQDFTDYLEIISDKNVDTNLINHSLNLVEELFINDSVTIPSSDNILGYETLDREQALLMQYLYDIPNIHHPLEFNIKTKSIIFSTPLKLDSTRKYNGILEASLIINGKKWNKNIDVHLIEVKKDFGKNSQTIKEVRLGNIY